MRGRQTEKDSSRLKGGAEYNVLQQNACQYLGYRAKAQFVTHNITALSPCLFNVREEILNTNDKSTPPSALLSVFTAEGY